MTDRTVVVVGAGAAGMCTAIEASKRGAKVHLVDKQGELGGMLHIANGEFSGAGSRRQRERGIQDDPHRHMQDVLRLSHGKVDHDLAWMSVSRQGRTVDWLEDLGLDFDPTTPALVHGHEVYDVPRTYWGKNHGLSVLRVLEGELLPLVKAEKVVVHRETRMLGLVTRSRRVTGVRVRYPGSADTGAELLGDAVVLATGGYDANPELRNQFLPDHCASVLVGCLNHATGDGLVAARELGAAVSHGGVFLPVMGLIPDPERPGHAVDYRRAFVELAPAYRTPAEVWINREGRRFVREDTESPEERERALLEQPGVEMHVVFDRAAAEAAEVPLIRNPRGDWDTARFLDACESSPWVSRGESLQDLARVLGVPADALCCTVADYNAAVESGRDVLGRTTLPAPIDRGPYYAVTSTAASILSRDGLKVDADLRVLDEGGQPLQGLFAVGEVLGNNVFAGDNYVGGMSITPAMTLGRVLGARLAGNPSTLTHQET